MRRLPTYLLLAIIVGLQYPLWLGKGSWQRVWEMDKKLAEQRLLNSQLKQRNAGMEAEVRDLKSGLDAIEERARFELGLIRQDEIFVQTPQGR